MSSSRQRWWLYLWLLLPLLGVVAAGVLLVRGEREAVLHEARVAAQRISPNIAKHLRSELQGLESYPFPGLDKEGNLIPKDFLYPDPPMPQPPNEAQKWFAEGRYDEVLHKDVYALSSAGLPLAPIALLQKLKSEKDPAQLLQRWQFLALVALEYVPSSMGPQLVEAGEAVLKRQGIDVQAAVPPSSQPPGARPWKTRDEWLRRWQNDEDIRNVMRLNAQAMASAKGSQWMYLATPNKNFGAPGITGRFHTVGREFLVIDGGRGAITKLLQPPRGSFTVWRTSFGIPGKSLATHGAAAEHFQKALGSYPLTRDLPPFCYVEAKLCGRVVASNRPALGLKERLDTAKAGDVEVVTYLMSGPAFREAIAKRMRWTGGALGLAFLACAFGSWLTLRSHRRLEELSAQKSNFISSVSHELRAPLSSIRLMSESLANGIVTDEARAREYHTLMLEESVRMSSLVDNVLATARLERGIKSHVFEECDPARLIEGVTRVLALRAERQQVTWKMEAAALDPMPKADAQALHQALLNLADNALKHAPQGSVITLAAKAEEQGWWSLSVADQGPGIPVAERRKVFEPFYRIGSELTRETTGTGLGLSLVRHIAQAHGGRAAIDDAPGGGARVTLHLHMNPA